MTMHSVIIICIFIGYFSVLSTVASQGQGNCNVCGKSGDPGSGDPEPDYPGRYKIILRGKKVKSSYTYPWVIGLQKPGDWKKSCGGAIINEYFILTAGHCVGNKKDKWDVRFQNNSIGRISKIFLHPQYFNENNTIKNDIALLKLQSPIQCGPSMIPICLPSPNTPSPNVGSKMGVNGWGSTEEGFKNRAKYASRDLREAQLTFVDPKSCEKNPNFDQKLLYCASGLGVEGVCYGDSGGIGYINKENVYLATGIASYHLSQDCKKNVPTTFTKISVYMDWITKVLGVKPSTATGY